jgi:drug/metabolite transporter (DMT)-like permease
MVDYSWLYFTLLSAILISFSAITQKKIFLKKENIKPSEIYFLNVLVQFFLVIILYFQFINITNFNFYIISLFLIKAITLILFTISYLYLLNKYEISKVSPILNLSPVILILFSITFLNEVLTLYQIIGILILILSTYFLEINISFHHKKNPHKEHFLFFKKISKLDFLIAFFMIFVISITAIVDRKILLSNVDVFSSIFFTSFLILLFYLIYFIYKKKLFSILKKLRSEPLLFLNGIFSFFSTLFILKALSIPTALVSLIIPIKRSSTLFSSIFGGILFHESHLFKKSILVIFMIFGIYLINI